MPPLNSFADVSTLIRLRRRDKGWTQAELAARSGIAEKHISRIENGANEPKISTVIAVMTALGLTLGAQEHTPASKVEDMF